MSAGFRTAAEHHGEDSERGRRGVCPRGGGNSVDSSYVPGSTKNGVRQGVIECHMADYKPEGRNELLRALVLRGFRFLGYSP